MPVSYSIHSCVFIPNGKIWMQNFNCPWCGEVLDKKTIEEVLKKVEKE